MKKGANEFEGYPEPKPQITAWMVISLIVVLGGAVGLGYVAFDALARMGYEFVPCLLFALVIEFGTFAASFHMIKGNRVTWVEIVLGLLTSGVFNFVHVRSINVNAVTKIADTDWFLLAVFGVGPLLIIFSAALWVGKEYAIYGAKMDGWKARATTWKLDQQKATVQAEQHDKEAERNIAARLELEKEKARLSAETEQERIRVEAETKAEIARARIEARERTRQDTTRPAELSGNFPSADWRKLPAEDRTIIATLTTAEIMRRYGVSDRTARNWRAAAQVALEPAHHNGKAA